MRKRVPVAYAAAGLAAVAVVGAPSVAAAQTMLCSQYPNPVYITGSSASQPVLAALATLHTDISIIYYNPDSCIGVSDVLAGRPTSTATTIAYLPSGGGAAIGCSPDSPNAQVGDIAVSDVFVKTCEDAGIVTLDSTTKLAEVEGPIQAMTFVAPSTSNATSISARAAYVVFGYAGMQYQVPQWNDPTGIFVRNYTSGTLNMIGKAIGLSSTKWANSGPGQGGTQQTTGTGAEFNDVANNSAQANANATIGIVSYEGVMQNNAKNSMATPAKPTVKILPYQHAGQSCGYLPDSTSQSPDRINVRQGRYAIWGPLHFIVKVDSNGYPIGQTGKADAIATILNDLIETGPKAMGTMDDTVPIQTAAFPSPGSDAGLTTSNTQLVIAAESTVSVGGVVPWCAMQVVRTNEIGDEASYQPDSACGCFFEKTATGNTVSSYCQPCTGDSSCTNASYPKCNFGFCEAQ
jgi:hypothetical protein